MRTSRRGSAPLARLAPWSGVCFIGGFINAVHADAATFEETDWPQIVALYDQPLALAPTPVVALNRAIAIGEIEGPAAALELVDELDLDSYYPVPRHASRPASAAGSAHPQSPLASRLDRRPGQPKPDRPPPHRPDGMTGAKHHSTSNPNTDRGGLDDRRAKPTSSGLI